MLQAPPLPTRHMKNMVKSHLLINASNRMIVDLRNLLFEKIQKLSIAKISRRTAGDLMNRVSGDTSQVQNFLINYLPSLLEQLLLFLAVGIVMLVYDVRLFLLVMLPTPFVVISFRLFWGSMRKLYHRRWQCSAKTNAVLHDIFSGIRVVKAFGMEEKEATVNDLITARSGVYHPASNGGDSKNKPERGTYKHGEHYLYNNWDFNFAGTALEFLVKGSFSNKIKLRLDVTPDPIPLYTDGQLYMKITYDGTEFFDGTKSTKMTYNGADVQLGLVTCYGDTSFSNVVIK